MRALTTPVQRNRPAYILLIALIIGLGLLWRSGLLPLSSFLTKYGGDSFWALVVFLCLGLVSPRWSILRVALAAVCVAWLVEFLQLYHAPWIDEIRSTRIGHFVLGSSFNAPDLLAYAAGIALGAAGEYFYFARQKSRMN